jgi:hypothetical protein
MGNDSTGSGNSSHPFKTISYALNYTYMTNNNNISLCLLGPASYNETTPVEIDTSKLIGLHFNGGENVSLSSMPIYPKPTGKILPGFILSFSQVTLNDQDIGNTNRTDAIFEKVIFNTVNIGNSDNPINWFVMAKYIDLVNCRADSISSGNLYLNNGGLEGTVYISDLIWEHVDGGFYIITSSLMLMDSAFKNSTSDDNLFVVLNSSNSTSVSLRNVSFSYNGINAPTFFNITDNSNITILQSTFTCNIYLGKDYSPGLVIPFFSTPGGPGSENIILYANNSVSRCSIQCPVPTLAINPHYELFPCVACGVGNGSVNYACKPCSYNTYSMAGVCEDCPSYSSQSLSGQNHCNCFSDSLVDDTNSERCNNEVWGIIISGLYLVVIGTIVFFKRPKKFEKFDHYHQIDNPQE